MVLGVQVLAEASFSGEINSAGNAISIRDARLVLWFGVPQLSVSLCA